MMSVIPFKESCEMANFIFRGGLYLSEMLAKGDLAERWASVAGGIRYASLFITPCPSAGLAKEMKSFGK